MSDNLSTVAQTAPQAPSMPQVLDTRSRSLHAHMTDKGVAPTQQRIAYAALPAMLRGRADARVPTGVAAAIVSVVERAWYHASEAGRQDADGQAVREFDALPVDLQARWPALMTGASYTALRHMQQEYQQAIAVDTPLEAVDPTHPPQLVTLTAPGAVAQSEFLTAPGHVIRYQRRIDGGHVAYLHERGTGRSRATVVHPTLAACHAEVLAEVNAYVVASQARQPPLE